jgi:hypothetical protein
LRPSNQIWAARFCCVARCPFASNRSCPVTEGGLLTPIRHTVLRRLALALQGERQYHRAGLVKLVCFGAVAALEPYCFCAQNALFLRYSRNCALTLPGPALPCSALPRSVLAMELVSPQPRSSKRRQTCTGASSWAAGVVQELAFMLVRHRRQVLRLFQAVWACRGSVICCEAATIDLLFITLAQFKMHAQISTMSTKHNAVCSHVLRDVGSRPSA